MKTKSGGLDGPGVKIGTQVVTTDKAVGGLLDSKDALRRDSCLLPFRDGIRNNTEALGELGLCHDFENRVEGTVVHLASYIHRRFSSVNRRLIDAGLPCADDKHMVDTPRPEHYPNFKDWLCAALEARKLKNYEFAAAIGVTPQAVSKWVKGGRVDKKHVEPIAIWAGSDYVTMRMLIDGKTAHAKKHAGELAKAPNWRAQRVMRKIESLAGDDEAIDMLDAMADRYLDRHARAKKPA